MSEKPIPLPKTELLEKIATEYSRLDDLLATLTEKYMTDSHVQDDWTVKDMVAHIASWERLATDRMEADIKDTSLIYPVIKDWDGVHAFNATCYQENQNKTLADVCQESQQIHQKFIETISKLDDDFIAKTLPFDWADGMTVFELIASNSYWHYKEHFDALVKRVSRDSSN